MVAAALVLAAVVAAADPAPAPSAAPSPSPSPAGAEAAPSLVDHVVTKALIEQGRPAEAKAVMPSAKVPVAARKPAADATSDLGKGELLLGKKDPKGALLAFRRALAKEPKSAAPLWGISRAADGMGDAPTARRYASLYVKSTAADRDANTASAAQWRLEQPDDADPVTSTQKPPVQPGIGPNAIPTSALPTTPPGQNAAPPPPTPY